MKPMALPLTLLAVVLLASSHSAPAAAEQGKAKVNKPADRVVVIYFHRTQRCPTCLRMGSYSEEAVVNGFAKQIKDGTVEFHYVDFQDKKNAALASVYRVTGPSLIVVKIVKNKVVEVRNLQEIWSKNRDKDVFFKYVQDSVTACRKPKKIALKPALGTLAQKTKNVF